MNKEYNLKLDLQFRCNNSKMIFDEFDENTSDFFMQINRQGEKVDISNAIPTLLVLKPSGVAVSQILNVKDNLVYGNLNNSLKNEVGTYIAKLMLVEGDKKTFISNISYEVTENALLGKIDNDIVEDERYSVLLQLLERLSNIELQEQTRIDNESSRIAAENLREESIEKIKNDIDFLVNETNKKVNDNLNSNTSKIDNLIIDTKEELNKYKENKDKFINEDLEEFKENTNKSIDNYKTSKDVEIDNVLNTYKTNTANDINSFKNTINSKIDKYKNDKDKAINEYIEAKELELDNYVEAKNKEIDNYKTSKSNELDLYISEKNALIDFKISEVDSAKTQMQDSINNKLIEVDNAEQIRQQEHESRQQFLNNFEGKLNTVVDDVATIKDDVVSVKEANKRQDVFLQGLYNENLDGRVTVKEEGSVISLTNSDDGLVDVVGLEGNTLVNYVQDGAKELTLNGDIDVEGTSVTLTEGVDNGLVDVALEGSTLINLWGKVRHTNQSDFDEKTYGSRPSENGFVEVKTNGSNWLTPGSMTVDLMKPNTVYTVIFEIKDSTYPLNLSNGTQPRVCITVPFVNSNNGINESVTNIDIVTPLINGVTIHKFTTGNDISGATYSLRTQFQPNQTEVGTCKFRAILLEGDRTNKEIPPYFEGMKSVGECEDNKIEIVSQGKNLLDINNILDTDKNLNLSKIIINNNNIAWDTTGQQDSVRCFYKIKVKPNTLYTFTSEINYGMVTIYKSLASTSNFPWDMNFIYGYKNHTKYTGGNCVLEFTTDSNEEYVYIRFSNENIANATTFENPMLRESSTSDSYIPYQPEDKKEITLSEPLRALPNGVKDRVVKIGGKWYIERNCGEVVLKDDVKIWLTQPSNFETMLCVYSDNSVAKSRSDVISDKLNKMKAYNTGVEGVTFYDSGRVNIDILKSKLETPNVEGFKKWLDINNPIIIVQKPTPTYEELPIDPTLNTYNDTTHISNNSTIPCNMTVTNTGYNAIIKPSTQYTVAFDTNKSGTIGINLAGSKVTTNNTVATVTTPSTLTDDSLRLTGKGIKASKVRLLEGNKTNWIPSYFEGLQSSFEEKVNDEGKYEIEILSKNRTLFQEDYISHVNSFEISNIKIEKSADKLIFTNMGSYFGNNFDDKRTLKLIPNTRYGLKVVTSVDTPATYIISGGLDIVKINNNFYNFTTDDSGYVAIYPYSAGTNNLKDVLFDIIIEPIDRFPSDKLEQSKIKLLINEPLRGVGDVKDRFVFKDGKLMIERNCGMCIIDENTRSGSWGTPKAPFRGVQFFFDFLNNTSPGKVALCPTVNSKLSGLTFENIYRYGDHFNLTLREEKFFNNTIEKWIKENNLTVVYELDEPTYEEVPFELQKIILEGYKNGTLFLDTNIPPTVEASYTANIPVVSKLNKVDETTETNTEDIAITQMAVDFLLMSTLGEEMLNFKVRSGYNMASYFASRIMKGALKYEDVINKYPQYKEDINSILISEGHSDLIIEL